MSLFHQVPLAPHLVIPRGDFLKSRIIEYLRQINKKKCGCINKGWNEEKVIICLVYKEKLPPVLLKIIWIYAVCLMPPKINRQYGYKRRIQYKKVNETLIFKQLPLMTKE